METSYFVINNYIITKLLTHWSTINLTPPINSEYIVEFVEWPSMNFFEEVSAHQLTKVSPRCGRLYPIYSQHRIQDATLRAQYLLIREPPTPENIKSH